MILFTISMILLVTLLLMGITTVAVGSISFIVVFADVIIFGLIVALIIKWIMSKWKK